MDRELIYLTYNDLSEETKNYILSLAKKEAFKVIKDYFLYKYGNYIDDHIINDVKDLARKIIDINRELKERHVELDDIVFEETDYEELDNVVKKLEDYINEKAKDEMKEFEYTFELDLPDYL